jgi:hypothetical protein
MLPMEPEVSLEASLEDSLVDQEALVDLKMFSSSLEEDSEGHVELGHLVSRVLARIPM